MSWYMMVTGKPAAAANKIKEEFGRNRCVEPEESFRQDLGALLHKMVLDFPPNLPVKIEASGSQGTGKPGEGNTHSLTLSIASLYGFVE
jgi:hypothetical protein